MQNDEGEEEKLSREDNEDDDWFSIDGSNASASAPTPLPPQRSASDTSNWDDRTSIAPDGREHIKDLGSDNTITD
jgi:hypothetical protein